MEWPEACLSDLTRVAYRDAPLIVVTTLTDRQRFTSDDIAELYGWRWDVEVHIRSYKSGMGMCELRCLTPDNLDREIAVAVPGYNLVRVLMCDTATVLEVHPREISFSAAHDAWVQFEDERTTVDDLAWMIHCTSSRLVRHRHGRHELPAIKRRQAKYPKLKVPRASHQCRKKTNDTPQPTPQKLHKSSTKAPQDA